MADLKLCKNCKHCRTDNMYSSLFIPVVGWIFWLRWRLDGSYLRLAKCSAQTMSDDDDERFLGMRSKPHYYHCITQRKFDCGADATWFEPK